MWSSRFTHKEEKNLFAFDWLQQRVCVSHQQQMHCSPNMYHLIIIITQLETNEIA